MVKMSRSSHQPLLPTVVSPISSKSMLQSPRSIHSPRLIQSARPTLQSPRCLHSPIQSPRSLSLQSMQSTNNHKRRRSSSPVYEIFQGRRAHKTIRRIRRMMPLFQIGLLVVILFLVVQSHMRASFAAEQLLQFKEEESLLLLQLQKVERHSLQLHENISKRLRRAGITDSASEDGPKTNPLHKQTSELYSMTEQLEAQTETLKHRIQDSAVDHIIREYGEGPVKVVLEIEFPDEEKFQKFDYYSSAANQHATFDGSDHLSIILWPDTPHAGWTWLEQIGRHVWDGAELSWSWNSQPVLAMTPAKPDPLGRGHLDFVETEHNKNLHGVWTVGLRENDHGQLQMFLNLQDNGEYHQHEVCVGKVFDGFEALQRIVEATRESDDMSSIRIKKASAMHVTKREIGVLYDELNRD